MSMASYMPPHNAVQTDNLQNILKGKMKDKTIASALVTEEYLAKYIRKRPLYRKIPSKPKAPESPFGCFPPEWKKKDCWNGNITQRVGGSVTGKATFMSMTPPKIAASVRPYDDKQKRPSTAKPRSSTEKKNQSNQTAQLPDTHSRPASAPPLRLKVKPPTRKVFNKRTEIPAPKLESSDLSDLITYMKRKGKFQPTPAKAMETSEQSILNQKKFKTNARPPAAGAYRRRAIKTSLFRKYYDRGDLPIAMEHRAGGNQIKWAVKPENLDYHAYLPMFFDGIREIADPYRFLSIQGTLDLIEACPGKLLPCIPQIILPMKEALESREPDIICPVLKIIQLMLTTDVRIGQALVPYYRQLLPVFNLLKNKNMNIGDKIYYNQRRRLCVGELISETLELMEATGGPDAFINIKYMIPTYQSTQIF